MQWRLFLLAATLGVAARAQAPAIPRSERGMPDVHVTHLGDLWTITGRLQTVTVDLTNLGIHVQTAGGPAWDFDPSAPRDLRLRSQDQDLSLSLSDALQKTPVPFDTGYQTGLKLTLNRWTRPGFRSEPVDFTVYLTLALEGPAEDLVCTLAADERNGNVRQADWPGALDAHEVDFTVLPAGHGTLLPRTWPHEYNPILPGRSPSSGTPSEPLPDTSFIQSHVIECWSMSWWGFQKGPASLMALVETPDDAAYTFSHPPGGPTKIGPRWRSTLGRLGYRRSIRFCFLPQGGYVAMAKRYRQYAIDTGLWVPLTEKIARTPAVASLIGTPLARVGILHNLKPDGFDYGHTAPDRRHVLHTYDERIAELEADKAAGIERLHVCLTGWPNQGYDRQHPDELPPSPEAGGWAGLERFVAACHRLGYVITFHDQYRDYYPDAASYDPQFAVHEEDANGAPIAFPGTRYGGGTKENGIPFLDYWEGGKQTYLSPAFMLGHLTKNYQALFAHGIKPDGVYLDVFGYVPPDEDYNPEHPETRTQAMADRAACYNWVRARMGLVGTEAGCDWTVPYVDVSSPIDPSRVIDIPLFNLVYHDAIITPYKTSTKRDILRGLLNGGLPQMFDPQRDSAANLTLIRTMSALHRRLALVEMTDQRFVDSGRHQEETRFADGTTVTVDWEHETFTIDPALPDH